jgi:hypothetical protein
MKFLEIIVENSSIKEAKLYAPAKKAFAKPDTGITIQNKSAYHVIKDCALMTINYLPLWAFGNYKNPFEELSGKFQRKDVEGFVSSIETNVMNQQLLSIILDKGRNIIRGEREDSIEEYKNNSEYNNPYGEYGTISAENSSTDEIKSNSSVVDALCKLFEVK